MTGEYYIALFNLWNRRPEEQTLLGTSIQDLRWLIQLIIVIVFIGLIVSGYLYFTYRRPGVLIVHSTPIGAEVILDRVSTGYTTPAVIKGIVPGSYLVEVRKDTLISEPAGAAILIEAGKNVSLNFNLTLPSIVAARKPNPSALPVNVSSPIPRYDTPYSDTNSSEEDFHPVIPHERSRIPVIGGSGRIFVSSNVPGGTIFIDGQQSAQETDAWLLVPLGTHHVQVRKEGFSVDPPEQSVFISTGFQEQRLDFKLLPKNILTQRKVTINTKPVQGSITVDTIRPSIGTWEGNLPYGSHSVSFGDVIGFIKPPPIRITVTETDPSRPITVVYKIGYAADLRIDETGKPVAGNLISWATGVRHPDVGGYLVDKAKGAPIVFVKQWNRYAWEFGFYNVNKNPVGGQFLQFEFNIPKHGSPNPAMFLWMQTVRGTKNYPLTFLNRTQGIITVNNRVVNPEWTPSREWGTTDPDGWERFAIADHLVDGRNIIRISSSDLNLRYFYISALKIGPQPEEESK